MALPERYMGLDWADTHDLPATMSRRDMLRRLVAVGQARQQLRLAEPLTQLANGVFPGLFVAAEQLVVLGAQYDRLTAELELRLASAPRRCDICWTEFAVRDGLWENACHACQSFDANESVTVQGCDHVYHAHCVQTMVAMRLRQGALVVPCPEPTCDARMSVLDIRRHVQDHPDGASLLRAHDERLVAAMHQRNVQSEPDVQALVDQGEAMHCPSCHTIIYHAGGCAHMACSVCLRVFVWRADASAADDAARDDNDARDGSDAAPASPAPAAADPPAVIEEAAAAVTEAAVVRRRLHALWEEGQRLTTPKHRDVPVDQDVSEARDIIYKHCEMAAADAAKVLRLGTDMQLSLATMTEPEANLLYHLLMDAGRQLETLQDVMRGMAARQRCTAMIFVHATATDDLHALDHHLQRIAQALTTVPYDQWNTQAIGSGSLCIRDVHVQPLRLTADAPTASPPQPVSACRLAQLRAWFPAPAPVSPAPSASAPASPALAPAAPTWPASAPASAPASPTGTAAPTEPQRPSLAQVVAAHSPAASPGVSLVVSSTPLAARVDPMSAWQAVGDFDAAAYALHMMDIVDGAVAVTSIISECGPQVDQALQM